MLRAAIAALLCLAVESHSSMSRDGGLLAELQRTAGTVRGIGPRLTITRGYAPCPGEAEPGLPGPTCPGIALPPRAVRRIAALSTRAAAAARASSDPDALHAAALIDLLWSDGTGKPLDRSISFLQTAARLSDRPAPVLADLAAALVVRAQRRQNPRDLLEAVEAADSAVYLEPANGAARYNLALALDLSEVDGQAAPAWKAYLAVDGTSGWAREARRRTTALLQAPRAPARPSADAPDQALAAYAASAPQAARTWGWEDLLSAWGAAVHRHDAAGAERALHTAEVLGRALERLGLDATLADAVRTIRSAPAGTGSLRALADGHLHVSAAHRAYREMEYDSLAVHARTALAIQPPSPVLRQWARHYTGVARVLKSQWAEAGALYQALLAEADTLRHPVLAGNAYALWGTALYRDGRYQGAREKYGRAAWHLARAAEPEQLGRAEFLLASAEFELGVTADAYASTHRALRALRGEPGSRWLHSILSVAAEHAAREGLLRTAIRLQDEGVAVGGRSARPANLAEGLVWRAQLLTAAGRTGRAAEDLRRAATLIEALPRDETRAWLAGDLRVSQATTLVGRNPERAAAVLDFEVDAAGGSRTSFRLLRALVGRANARLALGDAAGAARDLDRAALMVRENADSVRMAPLRSTLLRNARGVFDRLAMLQVARGDARGALRTVERGRTSFSLHRAEPPANGWVVPEGTVAVVYALMGDTLLAWTVSHSDLRLTRATVRRDTLARRIERTRSLLEMKAGGAVLETHLAGLYDVLVRPVQDRLGAGSEVVLLPDGELADVPFAALYDASARRFLIEKHALRVAGSLRDVTPGQRAAEFSQAVFAAPAYAGEGPSRLAALPRAAAEIRTVATLYPAPRMMAGSAAGVAALQGALNEARLFHFAGHAILDEERPERSFLAAAPDSAGTSGALTVAEIERMDLRNLRLVVLSACETLRARSGRQPGVRGLTTALMSAGAGGVVGSLWRVDDALTQDLMVEFHRAYRRSGSAADALREAQLRMLRSADPDRSSPAAWAGFQYTGN